MAFPSGQKTSGRWPTAPDQSRCGRHSVAQHHPRVRLGLRSLAMRLAVAKADVVASPLRIRRLALRLRPGPLSAVTMFTDAQGNACVLNSGDGTLHFLAYDRVVDSCSPAASFLPGYAVQTGIPDSQGVSVGPDGEVHWPRSALTPTRAPAARRWFASSCPPEPRPISSAPPTSSTSPVDWAPLALSLAWRPSSTSPTPGGAFTVGVERPLHLYIISASSTRTRATAGPAVAASGLKPSLSESFWPRTPRSDAPIPRPCTGPRTADPY